MSSAVDGTRSRVRQSKRFGRRNSPFVQTNRRLFECKTLDFVVGRFVSTVSNSVIFARTFSLAFAPPLHVRFEYDDEPFIRSFPFNRNFLPLFRTRYAYAEYLTRSAVFEYRGSITERRVCPRIDVSTIFLENYCYARAAT